MVPFFSGVGLSSELEAVAKYFVVQVVGSIILLLGSLFRLLYVGSVFVFYTSFVEVCCIVIRFGLMIKMGLVPFHFWIPSVIGGLR